MRPARRLNHLNHQLGLESLTQDGETPSSPFSPSLPRVVFAGGEEREENAAALNSLLFSVPGPRRATFFRHLTFLSDPACFGLSLRF